MDQPEWMTRAWAEVGEREIKGKRDNPRIIKYYHDVGQKGIKHDEVAWCAAFVGACLERSGIRSTKSLMARSYLKWGREIKEAKPGAIVVLKRGRNPALGHVGFLVRSTKRTLYLLGGNQSDSVNVSGYARSRLLGFRWPEGEAAPGEMDHEGGDGSPDVAGGASPVAAAPKALSGDDVFERSLAHILEMEGGYTDDPHDPGGATNFGITIGDFVRAKNTRLTGDNVGELKAQLRRISPGLVRDIYYDRYWRRAQCALFQAPLALMQFDCAVNQGVGRARKFLQRAARVEADGEIGPLTLAAVTDAQPGELLERYADLRRKHYRGLPHFWRFGRGWLRRVDETMKLARELAVALPGVTRANHDEIKELETMKHTDISNSTATGERKWWGQSVTIWGALLTAASTVLPVLGPLVGIELSAEVVRELGEHLMALVSAAGGIIGTLMTIMGRVRASSRLQRREFRLSM